MAGEHGPVEVRLSTCECPGKPHADGDVLWLRAKPDLDMGLAAQVALRESGHNRGDAEGSLVSAMVRYGVVAWTCRNEDGPIRPSPDAVVERLGWSPDTLTVANEARRLYMDPLLAPLVPAPSEPLPPSQEADSTSASPASSPTTPSSSGPSSHSGRAAGKQSATTGA